jgi:hypothetical protein
MNNPFSSSPPNELYVVGEHSEDPNQLLLKGSDGNFYAYELTEGDPHPVDVTDEWKVEHHGQDDLLLD